MSSTIASTLEYLNTLGLQANKSALAEICDQIGTTYPTLIAKGDELILYYQGKKTKIHYMPSEYHQWKTVCHLPMAFAAFTLANSSDPAIKASYTIFRESVLQIKKSKNFFEGIGKGKAECEEIVQNLLSFPEKVEQLPHIEIISLKVDAAARKLTKYAAEARIEALDRAMSAVSDALTSQEWERLSVIVMAGSDDAATNESSMLYFQKVFSQKHSSSRCPFHASSAQTPQEHNIVSVVTSKNSVARARLAQRIFDNRMGAIVLKSAEVMHSDILAGPTAKWLASHRIKWLKK